MSSAIKKIIRHLKDIFSWYINFFLKEKPNSDIIKAITQEEIERLVDVKNKDGVIYLLPYKNTKIKALLYAFKYEKSRKANTILRNILQRFLSEYMSEDLLLEQKYILTIPPISKARSKQYYNHLKGIANLEMENLSTKLDLFFYKREVKRQSSIKRRTERFSNLEGAFYIKDKVFVNGKNFIIVDDITTTTSTLSNLSKILKDNGAYKVVAITLAG